MRRALKIFLLTIPLILAAAAVMVLIVGPSLTPTRRGFAANVSDLRSQNLPPMVTDVPWPAGATDIWYVCHGRSATLSATFALGEAEFLDWAKAQGWSVRPIPENRGMMVARGLWPLIPPTYTKPSIRAGTKTEKS